jgi:hypothetical protein
MIGKKTHAMVQSMNAFKSNLIFGYKLIEPLIGALAFYTNLTQIYVEKTGKMSTF